MRVLFLTTSFPSKSAIKSMTGGEFIKRLAVGLSAKGVSVDVLAPHSHGFPNVDRDIFGTIKYVRYAYPSWFERFTYRSGISENLKKEKWLYLLLPLYILSSLYVLKSFAAHYDVVHSHWWPNGIPAFIVKKLTGKPYIVTIRGSDIWGIDKKPLSKLVAKLVLTNAFAITTPGISTLPELQKLEIDRCEIIKNPYHTKSSVNKHKDVGIKKSLELDGFFNVLYMGRLIEIKNPHLLVHAARIIVYDMKIRNIKFIFVGDGSQRTMIEELVDTHRLHDHVHVLGYRDDAIKFYNFADVFVSISSSENLWNNTIIEALMYGVPCVLTDVGLTSRKFTHGKDAFLIHPDETELSDAILSLYKDEKLRKTIGDGGCRLFESEFDYDRTIDSYIRIYRAALTVRA